MVAPCNRQLIHIAQAHEPSNHNLACDNVHHVLQPLPCALAEVLLNSWKIRQTPRFTSVWNGAKPQLVTSNKFCAVIYKTGCCYMPEQCGEHVLKFATEVERHNTLSKPCTGRVNPATPTAKQAEQLPSPRYTYDTTTQYGDQLQASAPRTTAYQRKTQRRPLRM